MLFGLISKTCFHHSNSKILSESDENQKHPNWCFQFLRYITQWHNGKFSDSMGSIGFCVVLSIQSCWVLLLQTPPQPHPAPPQHRHNTTETQTQPHPTLPQQPTTTTPPKHKPSPTQHRHSNPPQQITTETPTETQKPNQTRSPPWPITRSPPLKQPTTLNPITTDSNQPKTSEKEIEKKEKK